MQLLKALWRVSGPLVGWGGGWARMSRCRIQGLDLFILTPAPTEAALLSSILKYCGSAQDIIGRRREGKVWKPSPFCLNAATFPLCWLTPKMERSEPQIMGKIRIPRKSELRSGFYSNSVRLRSLWISCSLVSSSVKWGHGTYLLGLTGLLLDVEMLHNWAGKTPPESYYWHLCFDPPVLGLEPVCVLINIRFLKSVLRCSYYPRYASGSSPLYPTSSSISELLHSSWEAGSLGVNQRWRVIYSRSRSSWWTGFRLEPLRPSPRWGPTGHLLSVTH